MNVAGKNLRSRPEVFSKKDILRNFAKFTGEHLCHSPFFNKVASSCKFCEIFNNTFFLPLKRLCRHFKMLLRMGI